ncbi:hypothetical protein AZI87_10395 [Bdellovibrio bacteriovorus]|uniref:Uncharacterized protein n=1 Tax=Bdellovibrio bacteriovorus TaxID=959 RepID=A0A161PRT9_BDEBC|nr:hypothetical protein [Bdellovibrio bacteriovorus]KYG69573.1 hypothetical protein AZI87_10395 [Bdellovibrio bacteriovorus]
MKKANFLLTMIIYVFCAQAHAGLLFNYSQLALKDLDQMNKLVNDKVKESKKSSSGKVVPLKEALQAVYSRPNDDDMIDKIVAPLRSNLDELESWEKTISQLTDEAINALKNPRAFKPVVQTTYVIFLENLLAEVKPYVKSEGFERQIVERVRDAKIEVSKEAVNERKLRTMKSTASPSEIAEKILSQSTKPAETTPAADEKSSETSAENTSSGQ